MKKLRRILFAALILSLVMTLFAGLNVPVYAQDSITIAGNPYPGETLTVSLSNKVIKDLGRFYPDCVTYIWWSAPGGEITRGLGMTSYTLPLDKFQDSKTMIWVSIIVDGCNYNYSSPCFGPIVSPPEPPKPDLTGSVSIHGTPYYGEYLTAVLSDLPDFVDPETAVYSWYFVGEDAPAAVGKVQLADENWIGKDVYVTASFADYPDHVLTSDTVHIENNTTDPQKKDPIIIKVPKATDVFVADKLDKSNLYDGEANVPGKFEWTNPNTIVNISGNYSVTFIPDDTETYNTVALETFVKALERPTAPIVPVIPTLPVVAEHFTYVIGYEDKTFRSEGLISREEIATIFYRLLSVDLREANQANAAFSDVDAGRWSSVYIGTLQNLGIFSGYEDGTFKPGESITRAELAAIAVKFSGITGNWSESYIDEAIKAGFIVGYPDGAYYPDRFITRAEAVTLINRLLKRDINVDAFKTYGTSGIALFPDVDKSHWAFYNIVEASVAHKYTLDANGEIWK